MWGYHAAAGEPSPRTQRALAYSRVAGSHTGTVAIDAVVDALQEEFFAAQEDWQTPAALAVETLMALGRDADIVFLTAMPPRHAEARRRLLQRIGLTFPMVATEAAKGPVVHTLHGGRPLPVAFIDDIHYNHRSVGERSEREVDDEFLRGNEP